MICPNCNGSGKSTYSYTGNYKLEARSDYDGFVNVIVHCWGRIQSRFEVKELTNGDVQNNLSGE